MKTWLEPIRRVVLMAVIWAVVWAPLGVLLGIIVDPDGSMDEPWVAVGAYPGFLCAVVFSAVLGITDHRRRFDEVSLGRVIVWGALSGLIVIGLPLIGFLGTPNVEHPLYRWRIVIVGGVALLSAISAVGSVVVARIAKKRAGGNGSTGLA